MDFHDLKNLNFCVFGSKSAIKGELNLQGDITISSNIEGQINMLDDGKITIEREGHFDGIIYCQDLEVFGTVKGHIKAEGSVIVRSSAEVSGNIHAQNLTIYPGAVLNIEGHTQEL
jgi:cytoskeletal protein CcmA (bactofilin family)